MISNQLIDIYQTHWQRYDLHFVIINFTHIIQTNRAHGYYISQLIRYAKLSIQTFYNADVLWSQKLLSEEFLAISSPIFFQKVFFSEQIDTLNFS